MYSDFSRAVVGLYSGCVVVCKNVDKVSIAELIRIVCARMQCERELHRFAFGVGGVAIASVGRIVKLSYIISKENEFNIEVRCAAVKRRLPLKGFYLCARNADVGPLSMSSVQAARWLTPKTTITFRSRDTKVTRTAAHQPTLYWPNRCVPKAVLFFCTDATRCGAACGACPPLPPVLSPFQPSLVQPMCGTLARVQALPARTARALQISVPYASARSAVAIANGTTFSFAKRARITNTPFALLALVRRFYKTTGSARKRDFHWADLLMPRHTGRLRELMEVKSIPTGRLNFEKLSNRKRAIRFDIDLRVEISMQGGTLASDIYVEDFVMHAFHVPG
eukprot:IDg2441t1